MRSLLAAPLETAIEWLVENPMRVWAVLAVCALIVGRWEMPS